MVELLDDGDGTDSVSVSRSAFGSYLHSDASGETDEDSQARIVVPATATDGEAAALVACLGAYLRDRSIAGTDLATDDTADSWTLAGRYGCHSRNELPRTVERGDEWKMSGRTGWR